MLSFLETDAPLIPNLCCVTYFFLLDAYVLLFMNVHKNFRTIMNFVYCLSFYYAAVFEGPFSPNSYVLQEIFLHYLCNNFLPSPFCSYSKNISNSPPVFGLILHLPLGESCCLQILILERKGTAMLTSQNVLIQGSQHCQPSPELSVRLQGSSHCSSLT